MKTHKKENNLKRQNRNVNQQSNSESKNDSHFISFLNDFLKFAHENYIRIDLHNRKNENNLNIFRMHRNKSLISQATPRKLDSIYLFIIGLLGLFFGFMGFYSNHQELTTNYNMLLFNPILLLLLYFQIVKNKKWVLYCSYFSFFLLASYTLFMIDKVHLALVAPLIVTNSIVLIRIIVRNRN